MKTTKLFFILVFSILVAFTCCENKIFEPSLEVLELFERNRGLLLGVGFVQLESIILH